jgi:tripartite-type tricarboxylate transporter receptor subunit TctC
VSEAGLPGFAAAAWFGVVGPAGLPQPVVATLSRATLEALGSREVQDRLFASGVEVRPGPPDQFARLIQSEMEKWAKVVKAAGVRAD